MYYVTVENLIASLQKLPKDAEVSSIAYQIRGRDRALAFIDVRGEDIGSAPLMW